MFFVKSEAPDRDDSHMTYWLYHEEGHLKNFYYPSCGKSFLFGKCPECQRERSADASDFLM